MELNRVADFFDVMNIKQTHPRVTINMVGNLHQAKTIHVIEESDANPDGSNSSDKKSAKDKKLANAQEVVMKAVMGPSLAELTIQN